MPKVVAVNLDKERHLKLNMGTIKRYSIAMGGKKLSQIGNMEDMTPEEFIAFVWACLVWEDPELSIEAVEEMIDLSNVTYVAEKLGELVNPLEKSPTG